MSFGSCGFPEVRLCTSSVGVGGAGSLSEQAARKQAALLPTQLLLMQPDPREPRLGGRPVL